MHLIPKRTNTAKISSLSAESKLLVGELIQDTTKDVLYMANNSTDLIPCHNLYNIGDIIISDTSPGADWLACNGSVIDNINYPDLLSNLASVLGYIPDADLFDLTKYARLIDPANFGRVYFENGYFFECQGRAEASTIRVTNERIGYDYWLSVPIPIATPSHVVYRNGLYVILGSGKIAWATNPYGPWTEGVALPSTDTGFGIEYCKGYWIVPSLTSTVYYTTNLVSGTWSTASVSARAATTGAITFINNIVVIGVNGNSTVIWYSNVTSSPPTSWTSVANPATNKTGINRWCKDGTNIILVQGHQLVYSTNGTTYSAATLDSSGTNNLTGAMGFDSLSGMYFAHSGGRMFSAPSLTGTYSFLQSGTGLNSGYTDLIFGRTDKPAIICPGSALSVQWFNYFRSTQIKLPRKDNHWIKVQ